jgi:hypothetical protein
MTRRDLREHGRIVLARGEVTTHHHEVVALATLAPPTMEGAQFFEVDGQRELIVLEPCVLRHEEHEAFTLLPDGRARKGSAEVAYPALLRQGDVLLVPTSPGTWRHVQQAEQFTPGEWTRVAD